jgi:hypothetical protein
MFYCCNIVMKDVIFHMYIAQRHKYVRLFPFVIYYICFWLFKLCFLFTCSFDSFLSLGKLIFVRYGKWIFVYINGNLDIYISRKGIICKSRINWVRHWKLYSRKVVKYAEYLQAYNECYFYVNIICFSIVSKCH